MALIFVPFPVETKISGNFMSPNSSKENWFYPVCNSSFTLATGSHWIQQVTHLQTDGPTLPDPLQDQYTEMGCKNSYKYIKSL